MTPPQTEAPVRLDDRALKEIEPGLPQLVLSAELKRIDAEINNIKKSADKQEDKFTRAFEKLEATLEAKFEKIDQRFEKLEGKLDSNFKWLIGIYIPLTGMLLAAFYAFATYTR